MKVTVDTNVLVRSAVYDDQRQADIVAELMLQASVIAVSTSALCEFAWVLRGVYGFNKQHIALAIETLLAIPAVRANRPAAHAGLALLNAGGDFADGVIAHEGRWLGGETFVSSDRKAVSLLQASGVPARLLS